MSYLQCLHSLMDMVVSAKSDLAKRLGVLETLPIAPEILIVDVSQLFYHMVWPHGGNPSNLIASIQGATPTILTKLLSSTNKMLGPKMRCAGEVKLDYELSITTSLPKRDAILKSKNNKRRLASMFTVVHLGVFDHNEADVTLVSYVLKAAKNVDSDSCA